jgi:hypothetical protein
MTTAFVCDTLSGHSILKTCYIYSKTPNANKIILRIR